MMCSFGVRRQPPDHELERDSNVEPAKGVQNTTQTKHGPTARTPGVQPSSDMRRMPKAEIIPFGPHGHKTGGLLR
jgi:hypothetical protein